MEDPKVEETKIEVPQVVIPQVAGMTWKDYSTTAIQWLSIIGGAVWAIMAGIKGDNTGLAAGISLAVAGLAGGAKGSILEDLLNTVIAGIRGK